ncbi:hypothetical protein [Cellulomonas fimi]|nr:hypothetical protein [Cellulomonas fimi]
MTARPARRSPITAMWAWDNSVSPADDPRGRGYLPASPERLAAFAVAGGLERVDLAAPWDARTGPVGAWFSAASQALHDAGVEVGALGGDPAWLDDPALAARWLTDALAAGRVDHVHLDVEPWVTDEWEVDKPAAMRRLVAVLDAVRAAAGGVPVEVDAPWWLAHEAGDPLPGSPGGTFLDAVLARADTVTVLAYADHAQGVGGILALAERAVRASVEAGVPFAVGVETETPEVAGGALYTFYEEGPVALLEGSGVVAAALADEPGFRGIAVSHHRAWRRLLGV